MTEFSLFRLPSKILLLLNKEGTSYPAKIAASLNTAYSFVFDNVKKFTRSGLVESKKVGHILMVSLTEKGKLIAEEIEGIKDTWSGIR